MCHSSHSKTTPTVVVSFIRKLILFFCASVVSISTSTHLHIYAFCVPICRLMLWIYAIAPIHCFSFSKYIVSSYQRSALNGIANRNGQQRISNTQEDNRYLLNVWQRKEKGNVKTKFGQHVIFPVQIDGNNMVKFDSCFWVDACGGYGLIHAG